MRCGILWRGGVGLLLGVLGCMRTINVGDEPGVGGSPSTGGSHGNEEASGGLLALEGFGARGGSRNFATGGAFSAGGSLGSSGIPNSDGGSDGGQPRDTCVGTGILDTRPGTLLNIAYSSDGSLVATASSTGGLNVRVFRVSDNSLLWEVNAHQNSAYGVAFSPDGSVLASAGEVTNDSSQLKPGGVKLWRVSDGAYLRDVPVTPSFQTSAVEFSHDGTLLATAANSYVELWSVSDFTRVRTIPHPNAYSVHFSPDDSLLAADSAEMLPRVWRVADGSLVSTMVGHTYYVQDAKFSPDGSELATAAEDNTTRIWDVATGRQLQVIQQGTGTDVKYVNDVVWYDSNRLITNDWQGGLHSWVRAPNGNFQAECSQWVGPSQALALSPDRSELRVGGSDSAPNVFGGNFGMWIFDGLFP